MVALVIIALVAGGFGAIAWGVDRYRATFGALLPAGAAVVAAEILWMVTMAAGLGGSSATAWIPWILPMAVGGAVAWSVAGFVGRSRHHHLVERTNQILAIR
ncbi:hypothetical protein [Arthrobacter wenxiniae]|jgi:hypothetical protein|uniref:Uncharacterized protein n=1 Tax=Arthrobacter wenxiniae TaxID=2713570 RepID=A0A7Y7M026_9MICC|nr:hypothetical protein [Arthrobacter wenxiniae]NVM95306.1 hypothetical protein [Arthrobacter wenxiniae]